MTRIREPLEEDLHPALGPCEGSWLRFEDGSALLEDPNPARLFRREAGPREVDPGRDLVEEPRV